MSALQPEDAIDNDLPFERVEPTATLANTSNNQGSESTEPFHALESGSQIPDHYDIDIIRALVQDPYRVFVYWELCAQTQAAVSRYFSAEDTNGFHLALKSKGLDEEEVIHPVDGLTGYWVMVLPGRVYDFELGLSAANHGFIPLMRSNVVRTPDNTIATSTAKDGPDSADKSFEVLRVVDAAPNGDEDYHGLMTGSSTLRPPLTVTSGMTSRKR